MPWLAGGITVLIGLIIMVPAVRRVAVVILTVILLAWAYDTFVTEREVSPSLVQVINLRFSEDNPTYHSTRTFKVSGELYNNSSMEIQDAVITMRLFDCPTSFSPLSECRRLAEKRQDIYPYLKPNSAYRLQKYIAFNNMVDVKGALAATIEVGEFIGDKS